LAALWNNLANRKSYFWPVLGLSVLVLLGAGTCLFRYYYQRQLWDPKTAALVNGQPIYRAALEELMQAGLNPRQSAHPQGAALTIRQILDRLIIEELISQEAQKSGLTIPPEEMTAFIDQVRSFWPCQSQPQLPICQPTLGPEMAPFLKSVRQRQLLEKLAKKVIPGQIRPSSQKWRVFWRNWLVKMPLGPIYKVRVLFIQDSPGVEELIKKHWEKNLTIEELEVKIRLDGFTTLMSRAMSLSPRDPANRAVFGEVDLKEELKPQDDKFPYLAQAMKLPHSWAVVEVKDINPGLAPERLARAGRLAYEYEAGQEAFWQWVDQLKSRALIVINPNFPELIEPS
jgi:hypothetical protein